MRGACRAARFPARAVTWTRRRLSGCQARGRCPPARPQSRFGLRHAGVRGLHIRVGPQALRIWPFCAPRNPCLRLRNTVCACSASCCALATRNVHRPEVIRSARPVHGVRPPARRRDRPGLPPPAFSRLPGRCGTRRRPCSILPGCATCFCAACSPSSALRTPVWALLDRRDPGLRGLHAQLRLPKFFARLRHARLRVRDVGIGFDQSAPASRLRLIHLRPRRRYACLRAPLLWQYVRGIELNQQSAPAAPPAPPSPERPRSARAAEPTTRPVPPPAASPTP